jgi:hypothetical protein
MAFDEHEYFRERAFKEHKLAEIARNGKAAEIHLQLARMYAALAAEAEFRPSLFSSETPPSMRPN